MFLAEQATGDPQFLRAVFQVFNIAKIFAQTHSSKNGLLQAQVDSIQHIVQTDCGYLIVHRAMERLKPKYVRLIPFHDGCQSTNAYGQWNVAVDAGFDDVIRGFVNFLHVDGITRNGRRHADAGNLLFSFHLTNPSSLK